MATQKKNVVPAQKETTSSSSISQNNDTPKTANQSSGTGRTRNYAKLVYPTKEQYEKWYAEHSTYCDEETGEIKETPHYDGADGYGQAPDNWIEILKESHVACLVSPLHALDRLPDHTLKKPHYHVMLMFDGVKSWFFPILDPEKTAKRVIRAIEKNTRFKGVPFAFRFARLMQGLMPMRMTDWVFGEVFGIYHAMDNFRGRKN